MMKRTLITLLALLLCLIPWALGEAVPATVEPTSPPPAADPTSAAEGASLWELSEAMPTVPSSEPIESTAEPSDSPVMQVEPTAEPTPTPGRLAGLRIGIDPGHQAHGNYQKEAVSPGGREMKARVSDGTEGVVTRIPEYVTVLEIAFRLREVLVNEGAEVYMTRETHDVDISNQERARMMNVLGCDLVLRIHCDGAEGRSAHGIGLFVNESYPISLESRRAAECLLPRMAEATGAKPRGVFESDSYTGLNWSEVPCILVECGYMSNPDEDRLLNDIVYQYRLATGMAEGICDYFGRGAEAAADD